MTWHRDANLLLSDKEIHEHSSHTGTADADVTAFAAPLREFSRPLLSILRFALGIFRASLLFKSVTTTSCKTLLHIRVACLASGSPAERSLRSPVPPCDCDHGCPSPARGCRCSGGRAASRLVRVHCVRARARVRALCAHVRARVAVCRAVAARQVPACAGPGARAVRGKVSEPSPEPCHRCVRAMHPSAVSASRPSARVVAGL